MEIVVLGLLAAVAFLALLYRLGAREKERSDIELRERCARLNERLASVMRPCRTCLDQQALDENGNCPRCAAR